VGLKGGDLIGKRPTDDRVLECGCLTGVCGRCSSSESSNRARSDDCRSRLKVGVVDRYVVRVTQSPPYTQIY